MLVRILQIIILLIVLFVVGAAVSFAIWGAAGLLIFVGVVSVGLVGIALALKKLAGALVGRLFLAPFAAKGAVLKDATLTVHSLTAAEAPSEPALGAGDEVGDAEPYEADEDEEGEDYDDEEDEPETPREPLTWYYLDATVTPGPAKGPFTLWEPGEMVLALPEAASSTSLEDLDESDELGEVHDYRIWQDGRWVEDEMGKLRGEQRVRFHVGLLPNVTRFRLRYYLEVFGDVTVIPGTVTPVSEPVSAGQAPDWP